MSNLSSLTENMHSESMKIISNKDRSSGNSGDSLGIVVIEERLDSVLDF